MEAMRRADVPAAQKVCTDNLRKLAANDLKSSFQKLLSRKLQCIKLEGD